MKKLIWIGVICIGISGCAQKPGSGGGWVVGNPMMPEGMAEEAADQSTLGEQAAPTCSCKGKKKCACSKAK